MAGIDDRRHELGVPLGPAHVLRRAGPLAGQAQRVPLVRIGRRHVLDQDLVLPPVAEVVRVPHAGALGRDRVEPEVQLVVQGQLAGRVGFAVLGALHLERVQVAVVPAHRVLDRPVYPVQRVPARDE